MRSARLLLVCGLAACGGGGGEPRPDAMQVSFDRSAMLRNLGENVLLPAVRDFDARADALVTAIAAQCDALGTPDEEAARAAAQDAWKQVMLEWQRVETMQLGPVAMDNRLLRDRIYSWPVTSACAVDQEVMARWNDPASYDITTELVNRRGLAAVEYLTFAASLDTSCPPQSAPAGWDALSDADKRAARCGYAETAAIDLAAQAQVLRDAWEPEAGNYVDVLASAGEAGSPFESAHAAVNVVSDALFYVDYFVKDMKIAEPAGIVPNACGLAGTVCPAELESPHAPHGKENVLANLRAFRAVFTGGDGLGFDDFLAAVNAAELSTTMLADLDAAVAAVEAIPGDLGTAAVDAPEAVAAAHAAVKRVTDNLKSQFLTVLSLDIPDDVAADND
jgi:predicted lipoprotein